MTGVLIVLAVWLLVCAAVWFWVWASAVDDPYEPQERPQRPSAGVTWVQGPEQPPPPQFDPERDRIQWR